MPPDATATLTFVFREAKPAGVTIDGFFWALGQNHRDQLPTASTLASHFSHVPRKLSLRLFDLWFLASIGDLEGHREGVALADLVALPSWNTHKAHGDRVENALAWIRNRASSALDVTERPGGPVVRLTLPLHAVACDPPELAERYAGALAAQLARPEPGPAPATGASGDERAWPRVFGLAAVRMVPDFLGRERELTRLEELLIGTRQRPGEAAPVVVTGGSGAGKTQLAVAFARRHAARFEVVLFIPAAGPDLAAALGAWASAVGAHVSPLAGPLEHAEALRDALERCGPSLLVLDDVTDARAVSPWLPRRGPCRVLMTSKRPLIEGARPLVLEPLAPAEALALLGWYLPPDLARAPAEREALQALVAYFGRSPFALRVAAGHMGSAGMTPSALWAQVQRVGPAAIALEGVDVAGYPRNIAQVFELAYGWVAERMPSPRVLDHPLPEVVAWTLGLLAPGAAPRELVVAAVLALPGHAATHHDVISAIEAHHGISLVQCSGSDLYLHALPGRFFESRLPPARREVVIGAYLGALAQRAARHPGSPTLLPHVAKSRALIDALAPDLKRGAAARSPETREVDDGVGRPRGVGRRAAADTIPFRGPQGPPAPKAAGGGETDPARDALEIELLTWEAATLMQLQGYASDDTAAIFARSLALSRRMAPTPALFALEFMRWVLALTDAHLPAAEAQADRLAALAAQLGVPALTAAALQAQGAVASFQGRHDDAIVALERGIVLSDAAQTAREDTRQAQDPRVTCRCDLARSYLFTGRPDTALRLLHEALALALAEGHPFSEAFARFNLTMAHQYRDEPALAHAAAQEQLAVCERFGFRQFEWMGRVFLGWAIASLGDHDAGIEVVALGLARLDVLNANISRVADGALLAALHLALGRHDACRVAVGGALERMESGGERYFEPELWRVRGALAEATGEGEATAEAHYRRALAVAQEQGARWHELRVLTSLGRLLRSRGDLSTRAALDACLAAVREGHTLPHYQEAAAEREAHDQG